MPIFEYRCGACGQQFEQIIRGDAVASCPSCGTADVERLLSSFAVSSEGTTLRNRQTLGAQQRRKSASTQKERTFYKHDHHDD